MANYPNRKKLRDAVKTALTTDLAAYLATGGMFEYFTKNPGGISPFCCLDAGSVYYDLSGDETDPTRCVLVIGFWARRDGADGADDALDDLAYGMATSLSKNFNARLVSESATEYEDLEGVPSKFELHFVEFSIAEEQL